MTTLTRPEQYSQIRFNFLEAYPTGGTEKQQRYAKMIASDFLHTPHAYRQFAPADLEEVLKLCKSSFFWIDCKPDRFGTYASEQREAIATKIAVKKQEAINTAKAEATIAAMSPAQMARKIRRM